jgi:hypothetical protein
MTVKLWVFVGGEGVALEKLRKATISFVMALRPHRALLFSQDFFSLNLALEKFFSKFCRENLSFIKM